MPFVEFGQSELGLTYGKLFMIITTQKVAMQRVLRLDRIGASALLYIAAQSCVVWAGQPEIAIALDGQTVTNGQISAYDFGSSQIYQGRSVNVLVSNSGDGPLQLQGISVPFGYTTMGFLPTSIPAGDSSSFQLVLNPSLFGTYMGMITIQSDDADEASFSFPVTGTITMIPATFTFSQIPDTEFGTAPFVVTATGSSAAGTPIVFRVVSGPASLANRQPPLSGSGQAVVTILGAGTVVIEANQGGEGVIASAIPVRRTFEVARASAGIVITAPLQIADGTPKSVSITTTPASLTYTVTYNGNVDPPTVPGYYSVAATVTDGNYIGSAVAVFKLASGQPSTDTNADGKLTSLDLDSDEDGFPDHLEEFLGTSKLDSSAIPFSLADGMKTLELPGVLRIKKVRNEESISFKTKCDLPTGQAFEGQQIVIDVGGLSSAFTLDKEGRAANEKGKVSVHMLNREGKTKTPNTTINITIRRPSLRVLLDPASANRKKIEKQAVIILFLRNYYSGVLKK